MVLRYRRGARTCKQCGCSFVPKSTYFITFCSREHYFEYRRAHGMEYSRPKPMAIGSVCPVMEWHCVVCHGARVGRTRKRYCGPACRRVAVNIQCRNTLRVARAVARAIRPTPAPVSHTCRSCGVVFTVGDKRRHRFCSKNCRKWLDKQHARGLRVPEEWWPAVRARGRVVVVLSQGARAGGDTVPSGGG